MRRFDAQHKGYLDRNEFVRALAESKGVTLPPGPPGGFSPAAPSVGPWARPMFPATMAAMTGSAVGNPALAAADFPYLAAGTGSSIYGSAGLVGGGPGNLNRLGAIGGFDDSLKMRTAGQAGAMAAFLQQQGGQSAVALTQAFQTRLSALSSVAASLLGKREAMSHQVSCRSGREEGEE